MPTALITIYLLVLAMQTQNKDRSQNCKNSRLNAQSHESIIESNKSGILSVLNKNPSLYRSRFQRTRVASRCARKKMRKMWRQSSNLSVGMRRRSTDASKRESEDLETRTDIPRRFRGNEKNKRRRFLLSMRTQMDVEVEWLSKINFSHPSIFFSSCPISWKKTTRTRRANLLVTRTTYQNFVPIIYFVLHIYWFSHKLFTQTYCSLVDLKVKFRLQVPLQARVNTDCVGEVSYIAGYIGGNKYLREIGMLDIQGQFGEEAEEPKKAAPRKRRSPDKDAASCSLATFTFPSGDQFKYAWEREGGSRIGVRRKEGRKWRRVGCFADNLITPFHPPLSSFWPSPVQSRQTSLTQEDESESLRIISVRDNQLSQRECVARIGISGEIVERISALEMLKRDWRHQRLLV